MPIHVVPSKRFLSKARAEDEETQEQEMRISGDMMKLDTQRGETIGEKLGTLPLHR